MPVRCLNLVILQDLSGWTLPSFLAVWCARGRDCKEEEEPTKVAENIFPVFQDQAAKRTRRLLHNKMQSPRRKFFNALPKRIKALEKKNKSDPAKIMKTMSVSKAIAAMTIQVRRQGLELRTRHIFGTGKRSLRMSNALLLHHICVPTLLADARKQSAERNTKASAISKANAKCCRSKWSLK